MNENLRPKVGVGVLIIKNNQILLGKRKNAHGEGFWAPPGGHLEFNETIEECAKREIQEEVGIEIKNIKEIGFTNDFFKKENKHYITIFVTCDIESGNIQNMEPHKCEGWEFFDLNKIPENIFLSVKNAIKKGIFPLK